MVSTACRVHVTALLFSSCMLKRTGTFLVYISRGNVSNLRTLAHSFKVNYKRLLKRVSCPVSAVRLHSFGWVVVCEEKETRFLTVFRTLLKYMKLTATPMIWRRMAARVTSPRHCREAELAMAQRADGTQMSSEQQENTSSGQDESVQALLLRREGAERGGVKRREEEGGRGGHSRAVSGPLRAWRGR